MTKTLFICTHNSARSQMAEGFLRHMAADRFEVASAGTEKTQVRPEAIAVMQRRGIDISKQTSKTLDGFPDDDWDYVITVCDQANEACPVFPGARHRLHWSIDDPSLVEGPEREAAFERAATKIEQHITQWLSEL